MVDGLSRRRGAPMCGTPIRSSSSWMPTSPTMYTFLPVSLNFVCSRYAAAANEDEASVVDSVAGEGAEWECRCRGVGG